MIIYQISTSSFYYYLMDLAYMQMYWWKAVGIFWMITYTDGEARLCTITALVTVDAAVEGANARGVRRKGEVMVRPLTEDGDQMCVVGVIHYILVSCA